MNARRRLLGRLCPAVIWWRERSGARLRKEVWGNFARSSLPDMESQPISALGEPPWHSFMQPQLSAAAMFALGAITATPPRVTVECRLSAQGSTVAWISWVPRWAAARAGVAGRLGAARSRSLFVTTHAESLAITCTKLNAPPLRLTYAACRQDGLQYHAGRPLGESRNRLPQRRHLRLLFIMTEKLT